MSSPNKKRENKSAKGKNIYSIPFYQKGVYNSNNYSKQGLDKQLCLINSLPNKQNCKKYPKSPFLKKSKRLMDQELFIPEFSQQIVTQQLKERPLSNRFTHKKGRSMEIQNEKGSLRITQNDGKDHQRKIQNKKVIITDKLINYLKCKNSQSQMKDYQEFDKFYIKNKQIPNSNSNKPTASNLQQNKADKKGKRPKKKFSIESDEVKKLKKYSLSSRQSQKIQGLSNSGEIFKNQFKSIDLHAFPRSKSSMQDKKCRKTSTQLNHDLPFPSKLNSLYSNTTSLFCSKAQLEPLIDFQSYRIPSQEPENEIMEIRKFQSRALSTSNKLQDFKREKSPIKELSERMLNFSQKTEDIIRTYIKSNLPDPLIKSQSLLIQQGRSFDGQISGLLSPNQNLPQQLKQAQNLKKSDSQCEEKLNTVIKLISQTNSLGQEKKELLLAKIREIIPLAKIGSKQIERQPQNQRQAYYLNNPSTPSESLKSSFAESQCIQILNIKLLDQTLRQRENYLKERLQKQLKRLEDRKQMAIQDFQSQKKRLNKWINWQIKQTNHTRIQLWKGLSFANKLLENKSQKDLRKDEMMKCLSQKIIRHHKTNLNQKSQRIDEKQLPQNSNKLSITKQQPYQVFQIDIYDVHQIQQALQPKKQKQDQQQQSALVVTSHEKDQQIVEFSNSPDQETNSFRRNFIFTDSAQKIDYDFDDSSPILESSLDEIKINEHLLCELSDDASEQNSDRILMPSLSPVSRLEKFTALSQQDKEDIFEFIFLDLCLEIQAQNGSQSQIIKKISSFILKLKERAKRPRGFKTNPGSIREYLKNFINFLNNHRSYLVKIHEQLGRQMGPSSLQILNFLHPVNQKNGQQNEDLQPSVVLDIEMFQSFEKEYTDTIQISSYYDDELREKRRKVFLRNSMHIHNKAIFDAFNQELDRIRPFGLWGRPFQWKKVAKFEHQRTSVLTSKLILQSAEKTINFSHYMCGFIIDKDQCSIKDNPNVSQFDIQNIKSNRLKNLLADYLFELEEKLMFVDDEQVELLVGVQEFIFEKMVQQVVNFITF